MYKLHNNWKDIFKGFAIALDPRKIFLASCWLFFTLLGIECILYVFFKMYLNPGTSLFSSGKSLHIWNGNLIWHIFLVLSKHKILLPVYFIITWIIIWAYFLWCKFGGAIYRIAALELATRDRIRISLALGYSKKNYWHFFWAPILIFVICALLFFLNFAGGAIAFFLKEYLGFTGWLVFILGWGIWLVASAVIAILILGVLANKSLMFSAIAMDNYDCFTAISHAFMYFYHKIWHYILYQGLGLLYGLFVTFFTLLFSFLIWQITLLTVANGFGKELWQISTVAQHFFYSGNLANPKVPTVAFIILYTGYFSFLLSFFVSLYVSLQTIVYALLRKSLTGKLLDQYNCARPRDGSLPS